jgi:c-di-GMP-binding flagellar brake protein YcgR
MNVARYIPVETAVNVNCKCKCGNTFKVSLERRRFFRKGINLNGQCYYMNSDGTFFGVTVKDISRSGLKLMMNAEHNISIGENLKVTFILDDRPETKIHRNITVRAINGKYVGAQFPSSEHYDKLGQYLMFN